MSSFICPKCGTSILDTTNGYITECEHYPIEHEREKTNDSIKHIEKEHQ